MLVEHLLRNQNIIKVLEQVLTERQSQESKWGEQNHKPIEWISILGEEYGESCKAALEKHFCYEKAEGYSHLRAELIQVAAVAIAFIESLDRNELKPLPDEIPF